LWKEPDLYDDYGKINENGDETILTDDGIFYFSLGKQMYNQGFKSFDSVSIFTFLQDKPNVKSKFDEMGGCRTVEDLKNLINTDNIDAYHDKIVKANIMLQYYDKGFNILQNLNKFKNMTSQDVYDFFDYQLNSVAINVSHDMNIETLEIDDDFIAECNKGSTMGIAYGKICKILNYLTLGIPLSELFMLSSYSGGGKSSFVFENMIIPACESGIKCIVISNEQKSEAFKILLLIHILTQELNYWDLTRKKIKMGNFTQEQLDMLNKAKDIANEKYKTIKFYKMFDNDMNKITKYIRKYSKLGYNLVMYDTFKSEDEIDDNSMWQQLLMQSRKLLQLASKENIAIVTTYQLALHTLNQRYLNASCLSNAKQIKEVFSEMVYFRDIWADEFENERYDVKPYQLERDENGKYSKIRKMITLDKNKTYKIFFLDKSRNDETNVQLVYEFNGRYNKWTEVGYCTVVNTHQ
jgi:replicative DNA helicase